MLPKNGKNTTPKQVTGKTGQGQQNKGGTSLKSTPKKPTAKELKEQEKERLRLEEEQKRIALEMEQEKQKKELEVQKQLAEEKERKRLQEEQAELEKFYSKLEESKQTYEQKIKEQEEWSNYTSVNGKPDISKEKEMSTYISQYSEANQIQNLNIKKVIEDFQYTEDLISDLNPLIVKSQAYGDTAKIDWYNNNIRNLRDIGFNKLDEATAYVAENADLFIEEEEHTKIKNSNGSWSRPKDEKGNALKLELNKFYSFADIKYGIWLNPNEKVRQRFVTFGDKTIEVDTPRPLLNRKFLMRVIWTSFDPYTKDNYFKDYVVGGVIDISCFEFLGLPSKAKNWTMKHSYKESLKKIEYPSRDLNGPLSYQNVTPVKVTYTLPSYVYLKPGDPIKVAAWTEENQWISDDIKDVQFNQETRQLTFTTLRLVPHAIVQNRGLDYPYKSWDLRCIEDQKAILTIQGKRQNFNFEIGPEYAILLNRTEPQFAHLNNKKLEPGILLKELWKCGINLLPILQDAETCGIAQKVSQAELKAIDEISLAVRLFYIKSSKWNSHISQDKILFKIKENVEFEKEFAEDQEKDWKSIAIEFNKCACIKAKESASALDYSLVTDTETHSSLDILLKSHKLTREEWLVRLRQAEFVVFVNTLKRFLRLIHILSFTNE